MEDPIIFPRPLSQETVDPHLKVSFFQYSSGRISVSDRYHAYLPHVDMYHGHIPCLYTIYRYVPVPEFISESQLTSESGHTLVNYLSSGFNNQTPL